MLKSINITWTTVLRDKELYLQTIINTEKINNNFFIVNINWEDVRFYIDENSWNFIEVRGLSDMNNQEELNKYIFKIWDDEYYPNFTNWEYEGTFQYANKNSIFFAFEVLIWDSSIFWMDKTEKILDFLSKLKNKEFTNYDFKLISRILNIAMFIPYFERETTQEEILLALGRINLALDYYEIIDLISFEEAMKYIKQNWKEDFAKYLQELCFQRLELLHKTYTHPLFNMNNVNNIIWQ